MRVLFVTGTRADYSKQEEIIKAVAVDHKHIKVEIFSPSPFLISRFSVYGK